MEPLSNKLIDDSADRYLNDNWRYDEESGDLLDDLALDTFVKNNFSIIEKVVNSFGDNHIFDEALNNRDLGSILAEKQENHSLNSECTNVWLSSRYEEQMIIGISNATYSNNSNSIHNVADVDTINNKENQSEKPTYAQCLEYNKQYDNPISMGYHMQIAGGSDKLFDSAQYDYRTSTSQNLQNHQKREHLDGKEMECSKCNKRFKNIQSFQRHKKICGKDPTLTCTHCPYKTHWKYDLKCHIKRHEKIYQKLVQNNEASALDFLNDNRKQELYSGISKIQASFQRYCSKCKENFENKLLYNSYKCKNCKTKLLMRCIECDSLHKSRQALAYHLQKHCILKTKFECSMCDYSTNRAYNLKNHIQRIHAKIDSESYLLCNHCPFKTKRKNALISHLKSHMAIENMIQVCREKNATNVESKNDLVDSFSNDKWIFDEETGDLLDDLESEIYDGNNFNIMEEGADIFVEALNNIDLDSILAEKQENNSLNSECTNVQWPSIKHEQIDNEQPYKSILGISNATYSNNNNSIHNVADVDTINDKENQSFSKHSTLKFRHYCLHCNETRDVLRSYEKNDCVKCQKPMVFQCLKCNKQYDNLNNIQICGDPEKRFKCAQCDYKCSTSRPLRQHTRNKHFEGQEVKCSKCNKRFKNIISCRNHQKFCGKDQALTCTHCPYKTHWKSNLKSHLKTHEIYQKLVQNNKASVALDFLNDNRKQELYSGISKIQVSFQRYCSKCKENFVNNSFYNSNKCKNCKTKLLMRCIECDSLHKSRQALAYHLQQQCILKTKLQCFMCDYATTSRRNLKAQIQRIHAKIDSESYLLCNHCPFKTKTMIALINHVKSHMAIKNTVQVCKKKNATNVESRSKLSLGYCSKCDVSRKVAKSIAVCLTCNLPLVFPECINVETLTQQAQHLREKKEPDYFKCESCGKAFEQLSNFNCHKKVCKSKIFACN